MPKLLQIAFLLAIIVTDPTSISNAQVFEYDPAGRLIRVNYDDEKRFIRYSYDGAGNVTERTVGELPLFKNGFE